MLPLFTTPHSFTSRIIHKNINTLNITYIYIYIYIYIYNIYMYSYKLYFILHV